MRTFFRRLCVDPVDVGPVAKIAVPAADAHLERMAKAAALNCDEEALDRSRPEGPRQAPSQQPEQPRATVVPRRRRHI
jgi:hypothetical protein